MQARDQNFKLDNFRESAVTTEAYFSIRKTFASCSKLYADTVFIVFL